MTNKSFIRKDWLSLQLLGNLRAKNTSSEKMNEELQAENFDAMVDPGGFIIEPVIYVFEENPKKLVEKLKKEA